MIYYFTPFDTSKSIGKAHNQHCVLVPKLDDWICIRDADTMFLRPDFGKQIEDVIKRHGDDYKLFGCLTNRIASPHQLYNGKISNENNITKHIKIAEDCYFKDYSNVTNTIYPIAGMFMLFQKKTWIECGGFNDNSIVFDKEFSNMVTHLGGKMGVMQGLYIFHTYRIWSDNPTKYKKHLI